MLGRGFWGWRQDGERSAHATQASARRRAKEDFETGERYDMDHVYYVDGMDWHGAAHYYGISVRIRLGAGPQLPGDPLCVGRRPGVKPLLRETGRVELTTPRFALAYQVTRDTFRLTTLHLTRAPSG